MREIEILVKVLSKKKVLEKKLRKVSKFVGDILVEDIYYYDPLRKGKYFRNSGQFSESFRIRKKSNKVYITHKHDIFDRRGKWLYSDELETAIGDFHTAKKIIEALGMKKLIALKMLKKTFKTQKYEIVLESVRSLGLFLEVEALRVKAGETVAAVKKRIWGFIESLDAKTSKELGVGKAELALMAKNHHWQKSL
ncbi:hypothetical protein A3G55_00775 [Candidatus Giovannonibacteria bacterium RIFCSPLOWO2_12_FULL_44_25]|uniref:CYTH domain-containing protein n=2 Tax=Candidatus Giovannoniibacteriota TaxID=1752738 RepID=A0A1F5WB71_9BACT|nr:MAG: hypothetical protein UW15_C0011G0058 [Parcubacteria group bacterium GW2011_GWC1_44_10]KKT60470.1 MAG: hypothetical protein UW53_C0001G0120 [Candidatus Giovannonibacteria bacterium GW2011_GWA1_44_25]KKU30328.1 MAG: hypothetical protein UX43_C0001G0100 [Candidatus Giovannonibacteria bacterium GW2011_GWB1_46_20]OGF50532.1 MAG: hypothetical protein A2120_02710 [Candidatus Giovannonibacteria bacterium GWA2_45_15]OGF59665.1 MAG: hypothetical protein A2W40_04605 [Candidatus Giovannonibacteria 